MITLATTPGTITAAIGTSISARTTSSGSPIAAAQARAVESGPRSPPIHDWIGVTFGRIWRKPQSRVSPVSVRVIARISPNSAALPS